MCLVLQTEWRWCSEIHVFLTQSHTLLCTQNAKQERAYHLFLDLCHESSGWPSENSCDDPMKKATIPAKTIMSILRISCTPSLRGLYPVGCTFTDLPFLPPNEGCIRPYSLKPTHSIRYATYSNKVGPLENEAKKTT